MNLIRINRTKVELKLKAYGNAIVPNVYQSYQSGIEIDHLDLASKTPAKYQSYQSGIEIRIRHDDI